MKTSRRASSASSCPVLSQDFACCKIVLDRETAGERAKARRVLQGDSRDDLGLWNTK